MRPPMTWSALPVRSIDRPDPATRAAAIARQETWAIASGARFDALEVRVDATGNSTTHARRAIAVGEPIVTIPRRLIITDVELAATSTGEPDPYGGRGRSPRDTLATWLALEACRADSPWRPFLDVLPVQLPDLPMFRGDGDLDALAGTAAHVLAAEVHADVLATHGAFADEMRARVPLADYAWGRAIVGSRGFNAPDTIEQRIALIPIVDLMDHHPGETTWTYDLERAEYVVSALRAFDAGQAVHFDYGTYGNGHLLVEYGFALPDNPHDEALLMFGETPVIVSARFDERLMNALTLARPPAWEPGALDELAAAALRSVERLARGAPREPGSSSWDEICAVVRRGERKVLDEIVAFTAGASSQLLRDYRDWAAAAIADV